MLESIFSSSTATIDFGSCIACIAVAIILGVVISVVHKVTSKKTSSNFLMALVALPALVQVVILLVNGNLGTSLAVAGAFSLIRFRSMQGNAKEMISVFWAMAVGLALGMGYIVYSVIFTVIISVLMIVITKIANRKENVTDRKLKIIVPESLDYETVFDDLFDEFTKSRELEKVKTTNMGSMYELIYNVNMKEEESPKVFMDEIRTRNGNMLVALERPEYNEVEL